MLIYKMHIDTFNLKVNKVELAYDNLPTPLNGYKIGFVSDIHLGPSSSIDFLNLIIKELNSLNLDLLLLGGDYIWIRKHRVFSFKRNNLYSNTNNKINIRNIYKDIIDNFSKVETKDGIIAIYGNHDNWLYPKILKKFADNSKIRLGKGEVFNIKKGDALISVQTFDDFWKTLPSKKDVYKKLGKNEFRILLAHNPDTISFLDRYFPTKYNLSLSGHTHGGQIKLPLIQRMSNTYYNENIKKLSVLKEDSTYHYTSTGLGFTSVPFRLNVPPEIAVFTLKKK